MNMSMEEAKPTRVFIVDDHDLVRDAVAHLVDSVPDVQVVGQAATVAEALEQIFTALPDVVVLDVNLSDGNGIDMCRRLHGTNPDIRCVILTSHATDDVWDEAIRAGAAGFLLKSTSARGLIAAIREIAAGHSLVDPVS